MTVFTCKKNKFLIFQCLLKHFDYFYSQAEHLLSSVQSIPISNAIVSNICFIFLFSARSSDGHVVEYVLNQKKNIQLMIDSFPFHRCKSTKNKQYYNCAQATTFGCRARAHVDQMKRVTVMSQEHNHPAIVPRKIAGACRKQIQAMKKQNPKIKSENRSNAEENL